MTPKQMMSSEMSANTANAHLRTPFHRRAAASLRVSATDTYAGLMHISHSALAVVGAATAVVAITLVARPDLQQLVEAQAYEWLQNRQEAANVTDDGIEVDPLAVDRVTAAEPDSLPTAQARVTYWLSKKYRVAAEPLSVLVAEAFDAGDKIGVDPTLILGVMAVESRFNPYAQSPVGAQGLMQVLTRKHVEKYESFGGELAAFDPVSNLKVGVQVLRDCIRRAGSVEGGLRMYVGAVTSDGSFYINRVMSEHLRLKAVAEGKPVPRYFPQYTASISPEVGTVDAPSGVPASLSTGSETPAVSAEPIPTVMPGVAPALPHGNAPATPSLDSFGQSKALTSDAATNVRGPATAPLAPTTSPEKASPTARLDPAMEQAMAVAAANVY